MNHQSTNNVDESAKAVLFCPHCQYRAPWTEWIPGEETHELRCPSCGTTVG